MDAQNHNMPADLLATKAEDIFLTYINLCVDALSSSLVSSCYSPNHVCRLFKDQPETEWTSNLVSINERRH